MEGQMLGNRSSLGERKGPWLTYSLTQSYTANSCFRHCSNQSGWLNLREARGRGRWGRVGCGGWHLFPQLFQAGATVRHCAPLLDKFQNEHVARSPIAWAMEGILLLINLFGPYLGCSLDFCKHFNHSEKGRGGLGFCAKYTVGRRASSMT